MAKLSQESQETINKILKMANQRAHNSLKEFNYSIIKTSLVLNKYLEESGLLKNRPTRKASRNLIELMNKICEKSKKLHLNTKENGGKGLEIHASLKGIENDILYLDSICDSDIVFKQIYNVKESINNVRKNIAKTGFIDPLEVKKNEKKKEETPKRLKSIIKRLTDLVEDNELSEQCLFLAKAYLGRIVKLCHAKDDNYNKLIEDGCAEAEAMLESVIKCIESSTFTVTGPSLIASDSENT